MTNAERAWIQTKDRPRDLLELIEPELIAGRLERKSRLYLVACIRRLDSLLSPFDRDSLALSLRFADGQATIDEVSQRQRDYSIHYPRGAPTIARSPIQVASLLANACLYSADPNHCFDALLCNSEDAAWASSNADDEFRVQAAILKDIFGNPFRPVTVDPRWLTSTVLDLANQIYNERQFERMPLLADALMDAGCDSEEVIKHCQGPGPHVNGCYVVDLILGKE